MPDSRTVLVVDDEASVLSLVNRVLSEAGYQTVTAATGAEALELVEKGSVPDLLLTDLRMPIMTGDELTARLRQAHPMLKVLYLTGYSEQLFKEKPVLWKDEAFLDKPFTVRGLLEAVSLALCGHTVPVV